MKDILKKVRRLEIKIRRMVNTTFAGEYLSAFKGQGLEFDEVRPYQYGDDIRSIDWNVTAKTGDVFVKQFREEREQTLFVLFDISGSGDFGPAEENKRLIGMEITSVLAFSALKNNDKFGLATFSDRIEQYYKPDKGRKHILKIVSGVFAHDNKSEHTDISAALTFIRHTLHKRSILIVISDFLDEGYENALVRLHHKHELILIRLYHPNEVLASGAGIVPIIDIETQEARWINTDDPGTRKRMEAHFAATDRKLLDISRRHDIPYLSVDARKDYLPVLESFFRKRNYRKQRHATPSAVR
ncbi:MAG: DUF58 domain-containing protein [Bacteroidetes bacterium]|jgi:uncharacterized protein (DUF58 family)|nr:MAG: DUF58 domain-containing protein [Bacteroidota bacterium]